MSAVSIALTIMTAGGIAAITLFLIAKYQEDYMQGKINGSRGFHAGRARRAQACRVWAILVIFFIVLPGFIALLFNLN